MQSLKFRFRRRSGRRIGPGTGIGIAETQIQYLRILLDKTRRSINLALRSIGRSISTSRSESTVRATTGPSRSRTSQSSSRRRRCRRVRIEVPRFTRRPGSEPLRRLGDAGATRRRSWPRSCDEIGADPAEAPGAEDECCVARTSPGARDRGAAEEPQSLLLPQAPPTNRRDITATERFRRIRRGHGPAREGLGGRGARRRGPLRSRRSSVRRRSTSAASARVSRRPRSAPPASLL